MLDNDAQFAIKNQKTLYPSVSQDGLLVYYDSKGKNNTDVNKEKIVDLSGNKKHATLTGFAFDKGSGYSDGLVFDGVDDILTRPVLTGLTPTSMTYQMNSNILTYSADGTVKRVQDGRVIERKGINMIRNGNFFDGAKGWLVSGKSYTQDNCLYKVELTNAGCIDFTCNKGSKLYIQALVKSLNGAVQSIRVFDYQGYVNVETVGTNSLNEFKVIEGVVNARDTGIRLDLTGYGAVMKDVQAIDLTEAYGVGNEPTLEEIQADPEKWAWTPNPIDLAETTAIKGNIMGDVENIIEDLNKAYVEGVEVFTDKADDSIVRVDVDGISHQNGEPTPDYPIPIESLNNFDIVSSVGGRNLIPAFTNDKWTVGGATIDGYKMSVASGVFSSGFIYIDVKPNTSYTITFNSDHMRYYVYPYGYTDVNDFIRTVTEGSDKYTFNTGSLSKLHIVINTWSQRLSYERSIWDFSLIENGLDSVFTQAPEDILPDTKSDTIYKTNITLPEPLRSVGDVKDRLFRDNDGLWKIERNVIGNTIKWSDFQSMSLSQVNKVPYIAFNIQGDLSYATKGINSHIDKYLNPYANEDDDIFTIYKKDLRLRIKGLATKEDYRLWFEKQELNNSSMQNIHVLITPTTETLSQEFQTKLNNIQSFKGDNYVYTVHDKSSLFSPLLYTTFMSSDWYKSNLLIKSLKIYGRPLSNSEMLNNYNIEKRRWKP